MAFQPQAPWESRAYEAAVEARDSAHAPYSKFRVGAALVADGHVVRGMNLENRSFGATLCAERVAAAAAWSMGWRRWEGMAIAAEEAIVPCGICLQFLAEWAPDLPLLLINVSDGTEQRRTVDELLPYRFQGKWLIQ